MKNNRVKREGWKVQTKSETSETTQRGRGRGGSGEVHAHFLLVSSRNRGIGSDAIIIK